MTTQVANPSDILNPQMRKMGPEMSVVNEGMGVEEKARNLYLKSKDKVVATEEKFEHYVSAHPVKSVLVAVGVGAAFGFLMGRKR